MYDFDPPHGWTNDVKEMLVEETYKDPENLGNDLLQDLHFKTVPPIVSHTRQKGGTLHMFESGGIFYVWNVVEGTIHQFQTISFEEILNTMKNDHGSLKELQLRTGNLFEDM